MNADFMKALVDAGLVRIERSCVKATGDGWWARDSKAPQKRMPDAPLHEYLQWILEQLNYGQYELVAEQPGGEAETVVIGRQSANLPATREEVITHCQNRAMAVGLSGVLAAAREGGTVPELKPQIDYQNAYAEYVGAPNAQANTDMHYAQDLVGILRRMHDSAFKLSAIPLAGRAPTHAANLLREATRSYLFGVELGCFALCRANLESCLFARVGIAELTKERASDPKRGKLESLVNAAKRLGLLGPEEAEKAHDIRRAANAVLHGSGQPEMEAVDALRHLRSLLEVLFPS